MSGGGESSFYEYVEASRADLAGSDVLSAIPIYTFIHISTHLFEISSGKKFILRLIAGEIAFLLREEGAESSQPEKHTLNFVPSSQRPAQKISHNSIPISFVPANAS